MTNFEKEIDQSENQINTNHHCQYFKAKNREDKTDINRETNEQIKDQREAIVH